MTRGRPRKSGQRHPCGKRTAAQIEADRRIAEEDAKSVVVGTRMRHYKVSKKVASSDAMGSPLSRLVHWKYISQAQAEAGYDFAITMRAYLASARLQRPTAGAASLEAKAPSNDSETSVRGETRAKRYMEALAEIDISDAAYLAALPKDERGKHHFRATNSTTAIVWDVCVRESDRMGEAEIGALRVGLNAIHRVLYGRKAA